jgi:type IV secretion system protein VirB2
MDQHWDETPKPLHWAVVSVGRAPETGVAAIARKYSGELPDAALTLKFSENSRLESFFGCRTMALPNRLLGAQHLMIDRTRTALAAAVALVMSSQASAQAYADPQGSGVLVSAVNWLQGTLLGTIATVVAVIAVATVGFMMLTGRINWRYGVTVILGCFILFGASSIVAGIHSAATVGQ